MLYAGIDAGGTAFKCIIGTGPDRTVAEQAIAIAEPAQTLAECVDFFRTQAAIHGPFARLGIANFGPIDLNRDSPSYGYITSTPKPHWQNTDMVGYFQRALQVPVAFDTDVNGALLGEHTWGAAQGKHSVAYVTIGTGIGAGVMVDGRVLHGALHLESGHMLVPRHASDPFAGRCPYHGACLEGLASGPAIAERWQQDPASLADDHPAWALQAHYLAVLCVNLALMYSPQIIILGGGVMQRSVLFPLVRRAYSALMNAYVGDAQRSLTDFIVPAALGTRAGALGALVLARGEDCFTPDGSV